MVAGRTAISICNENNINLKNGGFSFGKYQLLTLFLDTFSIYIFSYLSNDFSTKAHYFGMSKK
jgi:hypothetical protein